MPLPSFGRSRSNGKAANADRRQNAPAPTADSTSADDPELSNYLAALAPHQEAESTGSGRRFGEAQVYQLRFTHVAGQQLRDLAAELGTSPQALAQDWVLERLTDETSGGRGDGRPAARADVPVSDPQATPASATGNGPRFAEEAITEEIPVERQHQWPGAPRRVR